MSSKQMAATTFSERRRPPPVRAFKRARLSRPVSRWSRADTGARADIELHHWQKASTQPISFTKYNIEPEVPHFTDESYEKHLEDPKWTKEETQDLLNLYRECSGKWPIIIDRYEGSPRTMEDLKARVFQLTAVMMQVATPISSMSRTDFDLYHDLLKFKPSQEASRKRLAEGHLQRRQNEVDEEAVLLAELQRIMANQQSLDERRDELRQRLDYPHANSNSYQYTTSQALTNLWQQLLAADRLRKNQRFPQSKLQQAGNIADASGAGSAQGSRQRDSMSGIHQDHHSSAHLSEKDKLRFGVTNCGPGEKLSSGVTFASDKLSKPRTAKSNIQTEKIATILSSIGIPELIPLPTSTVVDSFEGIMSKVHALLDLRKLAEKEEQELRIRESEAAKYAS